nr:hypothetical protein [Tanacetum cinerariifolium]
MRVNLQAQGVWDATQCEGVEDRQDRMALAAIYQAIPKDVLLMLADKDTAKEAWETLRTMHMGAERVNKAKVQTLRSDFEVIRMKDSESVDELAMRLNTIVLRLNPRTIFSLNALCQGIFMPVLLDGGTLVGVDFQSTSHLHVEVAIGKCFLY